MESNYKNIIKSLIVLPNNNPVLFSEEATIIEIIDESAGAFVQINQITDKDTSIRIIAEEWPEIKKAINKMIKICQTLNTQSIESKTND